MCVGAPTLDPESLLDFVNSNSSESMSFVSGGIPPSRWVVNFDFDLLDGLVFAALLAAHAPFLVQHRNLS